MNIQQMKYFVEVCRCGNMSKAAQNLYISTQGLSMAIMRLESEFSCQLFKRTAKGIQLNEEGAFLLEHAERIVREAELCTEYFANRNSGPASVKVASAYGALSEFAANTIQNFTADNPNVKISLTEYIDKICDRVIEQEEADIGLSVGPIDETRFDAELLFKRPMCLIVNKDNPLSKQSRIRTEDLEKLPMVMVNDDFKSADGFLKQCGELGVAPLPQIRVGEVIAVHRLVATNSMYAGLSVETVAKAVSTENTVAVPFENPAFTWEVYLITKKNRELMPSARALADYLIVSCKSGNERAAVTQETIN
ncbi:MAG: LysR family transcriptional regulator [Lachnospiraceae bacterium]|nr:LysR family transcriptional regulator [Lachnospiraceae bacterium]